MPPSGRSSSFRALARGEHVFLRHPAASDRAEFLRLVRASRKLHGSWVKPPGDARAFAAWLARSRSSERNASVLVCARSDGRIAGVFNLNEIVRGGFHSAYLGYYAFAPSSKHGLMSEGLQLVLRFAFRRLRLHRVEANVQPGNRASLALVRRAGFRREGFSPRYLRIVGRWRDHERWAILREEWQARRGDPITPGPRGGSVSGAPPDVSGGR